MSKSFFRDVFLIIRKAGSNFLKSDPIILAGALAFFTIFASPPIIIMIIFVAGLIIGEDIVNREIFNFINSAVGDEGTELIRNIVDNYFVEGLGLFEQVVSIGIFLFAASTYFIIIQKALNRVWQVKSRPENNLKKVLKDRLISFTLIFLMGSIFMLSLALEVAVVYLGDNLNLVISGVTPLLLNLFNYFVSFFAIMLILAMIYKYLPDVIIKWRVVWVGAAVTSFLFTLGKFLITMGLSGSNINDMYGAAGSTVIFLLWVFYSSLILFFGAEITQQYAKTFAKSIQPQEHAVRIVTHDADQDYLADEQNE